MTDEIDTALPESTSLISKTAEIVAAYAGHHPMRAAELGDLIATVHGALADLGKPATVEAPPVDLVPAVSIKKSVTDDFIISLEDGRKLKSMKRYLAGLGMTPADYRAKWGLPRDYPMVAPAYAAMRSAFAKAAGLGERRKAVAVSREPEPASEPEPAPKRRGRPKKVALG